MCQNFECLNIIHNKTYVDFFSSVFHILYKHVYLLVAGNWCDFSDPISRSSRIVVEESTRQEMHQFNNRRIATSEGERFSVPNQTEKVRAVEHQSIRSLFFLSSHMTCEIQDNETVHYILQLGSWGRRTTYNRRYMLCTHAISNILHLSHYTHRFDGVLRYLDSQHALYIYT